MVKIRLRRVGAKKKPSYRVVVADSRSPRDGRFIETIGFYNPSTDPPTVEIKEERALYWLQQGAQPSDAVSKMLKDKSIWDKLARLKRGEVIEEEEEAPPVAEEEFPPPLSEETAPVVTEEEMAAAVDEKEMPLAVEEETEDE